MAGNKQGNESEKKTGATDAKPTVIAREAAPTEKPLRRAFPGPRGAQSPLRVAVDRKAYAEIVGHAKESLNAEICGVLAGRVCEDDEGTFLHVQAAVRGTAASQGSTHVTFTHATWNAIHQSMEKDFPDLRIVGWYHSHPGFGVEFSEMDLFIQRNFFSSPTQIALVTDPLGGGVAVCINTPQGIEYLPRIWVDGREHEGKLPSRPAPTSGTTNTATTSTVSGDAEKKLQALEERIGQLVVAMDDQRNSMYRFLMFMGTLFAVAILCVAAYAIYYQMKSRVEPPRNVGFAQMPVQIGTNTALLGVQVVSWQLPPEMDVMQRAIEHVRLELEQAALAMQSNALSATNAANPNSPSPKP